MVKHYDLAVVGAGIVGLGVALAAAQKGLSVIVIDRDKRANGASIRNFGFVTVTGQKAGAHWQRARKSRDIWADIAPKANIPVLQHGLVLPAYRTEAVDVLHEFLQTEMGADCHLIDTKTAQEKIPLLRQSGIQEILFSPHELRVESASAIPQLQKWLTEALNVDFLWNATVKEVTDQGINSSAGLIRAESIAVCPGNEFSTLFPDLIATHDLKISTLQMLRLTAPNMPHLQSPVMSDLSLARYEGFTNLASSGALQNRLDQELPETREAGIHLIAVQSADGSLIVGDSHVYSDTPEPFASGKTEELILEAFKDVIDLPDYRVSERWTGSYAAASDRPILVERPAQNIRLVIVTGGTGASTGLALGEQIVTDLFDPNTETTEALS
ncbi:TIGR03364 family FAD-dependent oxidoreductase [Thalassospira sp. TSL5-1]|uniref:TIGR03364 family FAD-dependent oxidoreductase n=1 Tax=Thalassospira sp. TSL5-1 TaxID=1544451 RepID=UPI00094009DF|nr:TIGR03364 family FAD-dependent oxidoreductase [Thalassospira sp. TSL5-1]OKH86244.1 FAD-dependent oxidoreductase [Thalassospira sp. TSL5-1]